jgi:hypothetical protein
MAIRFRCPFCQQLLSIASRKAGMIARCPKCQRQLSVPLRVEDVDPASASLEAVEVIPQPYPDLPPPSRPAGPPTFVPGTFPGTIRQPLRAESRGYELIAALFAILVITAVYLLFAKRGLPSPSGLLGHGLGVVGFLMMLSTETLYSLRKRVRGFTLGQTSTWLRIHIFTGFVGSWLVLLHSAGKFNGLAGILTLLTVVMVVSGCIGRYIYTAVPRNLDGAEVAVRDLEEQIRGAEERLQALGLAPREEKVLAAALEMPQSGWMLVLGRGLLRWRQKRALHRAMSQLSAKGETRAAELERLLAERYRLQMQIHSLVMARKLLALWHVTHVPLGFALFTLAIIHIGGALYYTTFVR